MKPESLQRGSKKEYDEGYKRIFGHTGPKKDRDTEGDKTVSEVQLQQKNGRDD